MTSEMRKRSGLLSEYWYAAAKSEEVSDRSPLGRIVLGEMLVLWRTPEGRAVAMLDRCLHRNALLSAGDLFDGCIGCPYHGWTYDRTGRVVNVPSEGENGGPGGDRKITTFPVREQDGLIWVWMGLDGTPKPGVDPFVMPHVRSPGWGAYYMTTEFANNVTNLVENFMDVPHTVFVHRGWFRSRAKKRVETTVERTENSVLVTYDQPADSIGVTNLILNPKGLPMVHTDKFYMPNTTRVDYAFGDERAFIITSTCTPIDETRTMVYTLISYRLGLFNVVAKRLLPWYTRKVIQQNVEIMEIQGRGLRHYGYHEFQSTPADALHVHIEALRGWAESGGRTERPAPVVERMTFWI